MRREILFRWMIYDAATFMRFRLNIKDFFINFVKLKSLYANNLYEIAEKLILTFPKYNLYISR